MEQFLDDINNVIDLPLEFFDDEKEKSDDFIAWLESI